jgi:hypothetical protein
LRWPRSRERAHQAKRLRPGQRISSALRVASSLAANRSAGRRTLT